MSLAVSFVVIEKGGDVDHFKLNHNNEKQMKKCSAILPLHFSD